MINPKKVNENAPPCKCFLNRRTAIITAAVVGFVIATSLAIGLTIYLTSESGRDLRIIPRNDWMAKPPKETILNVLPVERVIISETASEGCSTQPSCSYRTKVIQEFHMTARQFVDIAYNFLIGGDGSVYEGRGWDLEGFHTARYNRNSLGISFIGNFQNEGPPTKQIEAAILLIREGVRLKKIAPDYRLYGSWQLTPTSSLDNALYEMIKKWSHWTQEQ